MELELAEGIDIHFDLNCYDPGEKPTRTDPGEGPTFDFSYAVKFEDVEYTDDLEKLRDSLTKVIEGECIQSLMEAEYKKKNPKD